MSGTLFDDPQGPNAPLAARMRPATLQGFVGQSHLLAPGSALRNAIETGQPHSMLLWGPPGSGKTTLARIVARAAAAELEELSAVSAGRPEVRAVIERARRRSVPTILFLDEIHRFNKAQQDALLPAVEEGLVTLIGATTENPAYEINAALLSRMRLYELHALTGEEIGALLDRTGIAMAPDAREFIARRSEGDARVALDTLALADTIADGPVSLDAAQDAMQRRAIAYDRAGDRHYDYISAWIKATRGSDPDASLYYLAAMLEGGEDPRFIARRMVILASEDIGNADPGALQTAVAAAHAVELVGLPEARHALAQAAIALALAPKSNAAHRAIDAAQAHIREHGAQPPPATLLSGGRGAGYDYPHDRPGHVSDQELAPDAVRGERFYRPDDAEAALRERLAEIRRARGREG